MCIYILQYYKIKIHPLEVDNFLKHKNNETRKHNRICINVIVLLCFLFKLPSHVLPFFYHGVIFVLFFYIFRTSCLFSFYLESMHGENQIWFALCCMESNLNNLQYLY